MLRNCIRILYRFLLMALMLSVKQNMNTHTSIRLRLHNRHVIVMKIRLFWLILITRDRIHNTYNGVHFTYYVFFDLNVETRYLKIIH